MASFRPASPAQKWFRLMFMKRYNRHPLHHLPEPQTQINLSEDEVFEELKPEVVKQIIKERTRLL